MQEGATEILGEEHSRQREQQAQRPWGTGDWTSVRRRVSCSWLPPQQLEWQLAYNRVEQIQHAAAAAKSPQSCPTLCNPRDGSPPGSPVPGILQARTLEWVAISQCMKVKSESEVTQLCPTLRDPMDCSLQAPLPMGFSRQEYWSGVPLPSLTVSV